MHYSLGLIKHIEDDIKAGLTPSQDVLDMLKQSIKDMEEGK